MSKKIKAKEIKSAEDLKRVYPEFVKQILNEILEKAKAKVLARRSEELKDNDNAK